MALRHTEHADSFLYQKLLDSYIQSNQNTGSTLFDSHHLLIDPDEPNRQHTWVDVVFPGLDRFALWNAAFITTEMAKSDLASEQAHEQISARLAAANETY